MEVRKTAVGVELACWKRCISRWAVVAACILAIVAVVGVFNERHRIYQQVLLTRVAYHAAPSDLPPEQMALRLFDATLEILSLSPPGRFAIDDDAGSSLIRGWAWCDSAAMAFVQIAERRGLHGQVLFLYNRDGVSNHSVAAIQLDGAWRIFDVSNGAVSRLSGGELATAADIAAGRAPSTADWVRADWFINPQVFYETQEPVGLRGGANQLVRAAADTLDHLAANQVQDLYLLFPPPTHVDTEENVRENWDEPGDKAYWQARNYQLFSRKKRARDAYEEAVTSPTTTHGEDARHFLSQLHLEVLDRTLGRGQPEVFNSGQGNQFTSQQLTNRLLARGVRISMDGRGRTLDSVSVERLRRTVKQDEVYFKGYETVPVAAQTGVVAPVAGLQDAGVCVSGAGGLSRGRGPAEAAVATQL